MIKSELSYNPYLLETVVKFNGQPPRINSLVEKYQYGALREWVDKIPYIFHDELDGYDFELEFSGTKLDYQEILNAFRAANVTDDMVHLFHKNILDGRYSKADAIDKLFEWLEKNPNRNFYFEAFKEKNYELTDNSYPYILVHGEDTDISVFEDSKINVEIIDDINEIKNTNLNNTPVVFNLTEGMICNLQEEIRVIFRHSEVIQQQLFFILNGKLEKNEIDRTLRDIGITKPQIVEKVDATEILKYVELFAVSDYIYKALKAFSSCTGSIQKKLDEKIKYTEEKNRDVYDTVFSINSDIEKLKSTRLLFENHDNINYPTQWNNCKNNYINAIKNWKNKKTKLTKESEAVEFANDFQKRLETLYSNAINEISIFSDSYRIVICNEFNEKYQSADVDTDFTPFKSSLKTSETPAFPDITEALLQIKTESTVVHKEDIFGKIIKKRAEEHEIGIDVNYNLSDWRDCAANIAEMNLTNYIDASFDNLRTYLDELSNEYIEQLNNLISIKESEKEKMANQLSDEDQLLQNDANWLTEFRDQLERIERR